MSILNSNIPKHLHVFTRRNSMFSNGVVGRTMIYISKDCTMEKHLLFLYHLYTVANVQMFLYFYIVTYIELIYFVCLL